MIRSNVGRCREKAVCGRERFEARWTDAEAMVRSRAGTWDDMDTATAVMAVLYRGVVTARRPVAGSKAYSGGGARAGGAGGTPSRRRAPPGAAR
jgi:hypothetical protein